MVGDKVVGVRCWLQMCRKETSRDRGRGQTGAIASGGAQCSCTCLHLNPGRCLPRIRPARILRLPCTGSGRKMGNRLQGGSLHLLFLEYVQQPLSEAPASSGVVASSSHSCHLERAAAAANATAARQPHSRRHQLEIRSDDVGHCYDT